MRTLLIKLVLFSLIVTLGLGSAVSGNAAQTKQTSFRIAAGGNPAICKANYDRCVGACGGMSGCIKQCGANYRGCLGQ